MSGIRTAQQTKKANIAVMGKELGELYSALWQEVVWIHSKWGQFVALYGTRPERVELLNRASAPFFGSLQGILFEDALLHIARITDSPKSAGKPNLSVKRIGPIIIDPALHSSIDHLIADCVAKSEFARDWRNRHLAHCDLSRAIAKTADPLKPASRAQVAEVLQSLASILNALSLHFLESTTHFDAIDSVGNAESLLYLLDEGLRSQEDRRQRIKGGTYDPRDLVRRSL
jgi:hypothetical protein